MQIDIQFQQKSNQATIRIDNEQVYYTSGNNGFFVHKIKLCSSFDQQLILEAYCRMLPPKFKIILSDRSVLAFKPDGLQALNYICETDGKRYDIYQHKDRKHSIFLNGKQIAYFDKAEISSFGADSYMLIADQDSDIELLIGFLLILHLVNGSSKQSIYSRDIGNIWEKKPFDDSWKAI